MIGFLLAILAIVSDVSPANVAQFTTGMQEGQEVNEPGTFVGWEWTCHDDDADPEGCYAGVIWIVSEDGQSREPILATGP